MYCKKWETRGQVISVSLVPFKREKEEETVSVLIRPAEYCKPDADDVQPFVPLKEEKSELMEDPDLPFLVKRTLTVRRGQCLDERIQQFIEDAGKELEDGEIQDTEGFADLRQLFVIICDYYFEPWNSLKTKTRRGPIKEPLGKIFGLDTSEKPYDSSQVSITPENYTLLPGARFETSKLPIKAYKEIRGLLTALGSKHIEEEFLEEAAQVKADENKRKNARTRLLHVREKWLSCSFHRERFETIDAMKPAVSGTFSNNTTRTDYKTACIPDSLHDLYDIALSISNTVKAKLPHQGNTLQGILYTGFESVYREKLVKAKEAVFSTLRPDTFGIDLQTNPGLLEPGVVPLIMQGIEADIHQGATCGLFASSALVDAMTMDGPDFRVRVSKSNKHEILWVGRLTSGPEDLGLLVDLLAHNPYPVLECHYRLFDLSENYPVPVIGVACGKSYQPALGQFLQRCADAIEEAHENGDLNMPLTWSDEECVDHHLKALGLKAVLGEKKTARKLRIKGTIMRKKLGELIPGKRKFQDQDDILGPEFPQMFLWGGGGHKDRQREWGTEESQKLQELKEDNGVKLEMTTALEEYIKSKWNIDAY